MKSATAVALGGLLMLWPALVNGYPLVFSDTAALAEMGLAPTIGWDKPWVYGPLILLLHWSISLWGVAVAQALLVSLAVWLVARVLGVASLWRHLAVCGVLAVGSAAPWFASFVMPDIFAPLTVLCLFLLVWGRPALPGWTRLAFGVIATIAIASHLTHLLIAAACCAVVLLTRPRRLGVCVLPLLAALGWLLVCNWVGNGVLGISPFGSVFALARLQADGPAADYLHEACPALGGRMCAWSSRLPMDSDAFLWEPEGPMWGGHYGPTYLAPEASRIVAATIGYEPWRVAVAAATNTVRQLGRVALGDTLGPDYLEVTVGLLLRTYFPAAEQARLAVSRQVAGTLRPVAAPFAAVDLALLALGAAATLAMVPIAWRSWPALTGLAMLVLAGVLANAFATGALSGPHDRYGARIAWLVVLAPALALPWPPASQRRDRAPVA